jgi:hypothetical protein
MDHHHKPFCQHRQHRPNHYHQPRAQHTIHHQPRQMVLKLRSLSQAPFIL